jgi:putative tryptophan/tyrosine transport system substrate-binding protein
VPERVWTFWPHPPYRPGMDRRRFLLTLLVCALGVPLVAEAQNLPRIGLLSTAADPSRPIAWVPFLERLTELGYVEGRNITLERRFAAGKPERLDELVADLAHLRVDIVVATGVPETLTAKRAMPTTPIVMIFVPDPVGEGLVASLARPGGNVTGLSTLAPELYAKRLQLLKEAIPAVTRVGLLLNPANAHSAAASREITAAARGLSVQIHGLVVRSPLDLDRAFSAITREHLQAMFVVTDAISFNQRARIADFATKSNLPTMYELRDYVEAGGLMAYGPSIADLSRRAATYVDKILKGSRPADLPVEQPTRFELVINVKTAKVLGLTIPPSLLQRADQVIDP